MRPKRADPAGPAYCAYGMRYVRKGYTSLKKEIKGAQTGDDPEHIHRMRVASRRLRAALPLFSSCFPKKKYRTWFRAVRSITSSLGRARDLDVQIAFLEEYMKSRRAGKVNAPQEKPWQEADLSGLESLFRRLKSERAAIQPGIDAIAGFFQENGVFSDFSEAILMAEKAGRTRVDLRKRAFRETEKRCAALIVFDPCVRRPHAIEAHHAMRIAAKKYRYTMEIFNDACDGNYEGLIRSIQTLQEILGIMHDCDVWTQTLQEQCSPGKPLSGEECRAVNGDAGLIDLLEDRKNQRRILHQELVRVWDEFRAQQIAGRIPDPR